VGFWNWTVLIGHTVFDTIPSVPDPTRSFTSAPLSGFRCEAIRDKKGEVELKWEPLEGPARQAGAGDAGGLVVAAVGRQARADGRRGVARVQDALAETCGCGFTSFKQDFRFS